MNEIPSNTWIWMGIPLIGLGLNLFWPRKKSIKLIALLFVIVTACLHGFSGLNPLDRVINLTDRILTGQQSGTTEQILNNLRIAQRLAHQTIFDVTLGLSLAIALALTPVDIIAKIRSHFFRTSNDNLNRKS